jgi:predicted permease
MFIAGYAWSRNMAKFCVEHAESGFCRLVFLLRDATRQLARHPGFTVTALLSLALGIGASAAIFSLLNALLFRPLPVSRPEQLAYVGPASSTAASSSAAAARSAPGAVSSLLLAALRDDPEVAGACGFLPPATTVQYGDDRSTVRVSALAFTEDCFATLGVRPAIGRLFDRSDSGRQDAKVAVISYDVWQREYAGRADIVGQTLRLEGVLSTIVGVTESGFAGLVLGFPAQVMYPIAQHFGPSPGAPPGSEPTYVASAIVRHQPDGSFERLRAHLVEVWPRLLEVTAPTSASLEERDRYRAQRLIVAPATTPVDYSLRNRFGTPLYVMLGISALVLLFCCVNVANLMLARGVARRREMAIRLAIGATRRTLIRQVTAESIVLVTGGVFAGLFVAYVGASALVQILRANYTGLELDATPDSRVLLLCSAAAAFAVCVAGVLPAWRISDVCASAALKANGRSICSGGMTRKALVAVQMGLTLVLLTGAFLFVQSLRDLRWTDLGFQPSHVVSAQLVPLPGAGGEAPQEQSEREAIIERMRALPGVTGVSLTNTAPLGRSTPQPVLLDRAGVDRAAMPVHQVVVSNGYFQTLGIRLLQGVDFRAADGAAAVADVIVSESLARKAFPEGNALGQQLRIASRQKVRTVTVVGVAADARIFGPKGDIPPVLYLNFWQAREYQQAPMLLVRTAGEASRMTETVRRTIAAKGSEYATYVRATDAQLDIQLLQERLLAWLATVFGLITLLLAAIGLFGLLSYLVTSRVPEIGLRLALGAPAGSVWRLFMWEGMVLTGIGAMVGMFLTWMLASFVSHVLNGAFSAILPQIAGTAAVLMAVGAVAALLPASRAARLGVLASLRQE